jgi:hypothetical protein
MSKELSIIDLPDDVLEIINTFIQYYHPWKENIIQWESKIIKTYLNKLLRKQKEKVHKICVSFYIRNSEGPLIKIYMYNCQNEIIVYGEGTSDSTRWYFFRSDSKPLEVKKDELKNEILKIKEHVKNLIHLQYSST